MRYEVDVLVAGAGPAGAAAGIAAHRRGLRTLVVDKATFPRDKTCGDGLTTCALRWTERLGLDVRRLPGYAPIRDTVLSAPGGRRTVLPLPIRGQYAGVVPRMELDAALVGVARAQGVPVRDGAAVTDVRVAGDRVDTTLGDGTDVRAGYVIAADGHYSTVRRCLGILDAPELGTWHAFRRYFRSVRDRRLWVLFEEDLLPGYAWVFPLPNGRANVGYGVRREAGTTGKELAAHWRELLARPALREALGPAAEPEGAHRAWPIPAAFDVARLADTRVLFAGDAAGVVDPLTGEGIAQAIETGVLAVDAIAAGGCTQSSVADRYRAAVTRALGADLRIAAALHHVLRSPRRTRLALRVADLSDWTRAQFARWMFEDYPRAVLLTPRRWRRGVFAGPGAYRPPS